MKVRWLGWVLLGLFVCVLAIAIALGLDPPQGDPVKFTDILWATSFVAYPITGALIVSRFPSKPLGWIFCTGPLLAMCAVLAADLADGGRVQGQGARWLAWGNDIMFQAGLGLLLTAPLLMPEGDSPRGRMRWVWRAIIVAGTGWTLRAALAPGELNTFPEYTNPVGVGFLGPLLDVLETVLFPIVFLCFVIAVISLFVRFRRAQGRERLQLKWIALGAFGIPFGVGLIFFLDIFFELTETVVTLCSMIAILSLPLAVGTAMLRHRLYEVDRVINRAIVYALVTASLVACYLGLVFALQVLLEPLTQDSDVAIAASTLAVAALFRPLRARIQALIDRRFYRSKYNASLTLAGFGTCLRDEIDLEVLQDDIEQVLRDTLQPAHVGVWLRSGSSA